MKSVEKFLIDNKFELYSYYCENKRYSKQINPYQVLYVRIYSTINKIIEVEYEDISNDMLQFRDDRIVPLDNVNTLKRLKFLLQAIL